MGLKTTSSQNKATATATSEETGLAFLEAVRILEIAHADDLKMLSRTNRGPIVTAVWDNGDISAVLFNERAMRAALKDPFHKAPAEFKETTDAFLEYGALVFLKDEGEIERAESYLAWADGIPA